jgi:hypothetical protein
MGQLQKLERLKQELLETDSLLKSPRVGGGTRYVLQQLRKDLARQIESLERKTTETRTESAG